MSSNCPCGSQKSISDCCLPYIEGTAKAPTPEALMRSRYTAYTLHNVDYIEDTMLGAVKAEFDKEKALEWAKKSQWDRLEMIHTEFKTPTQGFVEFKAFYTIAQKQYCLHELSEFTLQDNTWFYIDGNEVKPHPFLRANEKLGRNDPCSCGSGKKYKKCCG